MVGGLPCLRCAVRTRTRRDPELRRPVELLAGDRLRHRGPGGLARFAGRAVCRARRRLRPLAQHDRQPRDRRHPVAAAVAASAGIPAGLGFSGLDGERLPAAVRHVRVDEPPAGPRGLACGGPTRDPGLLLRIAARSTTWTSTPDAVVAASAAAFLDQHAGHFWPAARWPATASTGTLLCDGHGTRGGGVAPASPASTYGPTWPARNATCSRCPAAGASGSGGQVRLRQPRSGRRLDPVRPGRRLHQAAVLSGLEAANTVLGRSLTDAISGSWYGLGS